MQYTFTKHHRLNFGQALYLTGNTPQLGQWNTAKCIRMKCLFEDFWAVSLPVSISGLIQYAFLINNFDKPIFPEANAKNIIYQGTSYKLLVPPIKQCRNLTLMSLNIRCMSREDQGIFHWDNRKQNLIETVLQTSPDILATQQVTPKQGKYLEDRLTPLYTYYARIRSPNSEQIGFFIRRDKFRVVQDQYVWMSESRKQYSKGFDAALPRLFALIVLQPIYKELLLAPFIVVNTHLDHVGQIARAEGVKIISSVCQEIAEKYKITDVFVTGDFNTAEKDHIFHNLSIRGVQMKSMRSMLPMQNNDLQLTFRAFKNYYKEIDSKNHYENAIIDHIFASLYNYKAQNFKVIRRIDKIVSDHYPIIGQFSLNMK